MDIALSLCGRAMNTIRASFLRFVAQTSPSPDGLEVSHGEGIYLFDLNGKRYIDGISGVAVSSLGHHHPVILEAIKRQLDKHLHTSVYGEHIQAPQVTLAEHLAAHLPDNLQCTFFTNSGAETVETALKTARRYTNRHEIIACRNAYHGSTPGAESLRSDNDYTAASRPLVPGVRHIRFNEFSDIDIITRKTAAVIIEPVQGEAGVIEPVQGYLQAVRERCRQTGTLLIFDEIQTGLGRTGDLWAFMHDGVVPDMLLLAKAFGGGLPLGACISSRDIMGILSNNPILGHISTFGGNPLCCAAGLAALQVVEQPEFLEAVKDNGRHLKDRLTGHHAIKEVRGRGLMLALELKVPDRLFDVITVCKQRGLLVDWFLFNDRSVRLYPPLVISAKETEILGDILTEALS